MTLLNLNLSQFGQSLFSSCSFIYFNLKILSKSVLKDLPPLIAFTEKFFKFLAKTEGWYPMLKTIVKKSYLVRIWTNALWKIEFEKTFLMKNMKKIRNFVSTLIGSEIWSKIEILITFKNYNLNCCLPDRI